MWAVLLTEGCRKIKLQYYAFKLASSTRSYYCAVSSFCLVFTAVYLPAFCLLKMARICYNNNYS